MSREAVQKYAPNLLNGSATDMAAFCPNYSTMNQQQKLDFWAGFLRALSPHESGCKSNPTPFKEISLGVDAVTGLPVYSAGLFQLSYQDENSYRGKLPPGVCDFSYDKNTKTGDIEDPRKNIECGFAILNYGIGRNGSIAYDKGQYWAVLKPAGKYSKVIPIQGATRKLPGCSN